MSAGQLEVGSNLRGEVVINHPKLDTDDHGVGHIVFTPAQARGLAASLLRQADNTDQRPRPIAAISKVHFEVDQHQPNRGRMLVIVEAHGTLEEIACWREELMETSAYPVEIVPRVGR